MKTPGSALRVSLLALATLISPCGAVCEDERVIDAVVATVNGEPFTLHDLCKRLSPPRKLTLAQASVDPEARQVLDDLILEKLIEEEAKTRRINVSPEEVEGYLDQLAARNNLSREEFARALQQQQGKEIETFKREISAQILKSKLASELLRGGLAVTDEEIDSYIKQHPEMGRSGGKIKLSHIFVSTTGRGEEEAKKIIQMVRDKIKKGEKFADLARKYSESPEAARGGALGLIDEKDLDPQIFEAIFSLPAGQVSEIVAAGPGFRLFYIEDRISADKGGDQAKLHEEVARILKQQKLELKLENYFSSDLYSAYSVDKKI